VIQREMWKARVLRLIRVFSFLFFSFLSFVLIYNCKSRAHTRVEHVPVENLTMVKIGLYFISFLFFVFHVRLSPSFPKKKNILVCLFKLHWMGDLLKNNRYIKL